MKFTLPTDERSKQLISGLLEETFMNRRMWINEKGPTIAEIVEEYPRLLDFDGDMV